MLCIRKHNGKTTAAAHCDKCGNGYEWSGNISITRIEHYLRGKGWTAGKRHLCLDCKGDKKP